MEVSTIRFHGHEKVQSQVITLETRDRDGGGLDGYLRTNLNGHEAGNGGYSQGLT